MDYTPGVFDILLTNTKTHPDFKRWNGDPNVQSRVNTTLAKQIANWVILYSPVQMASDLIQHYEGHPAFQFFRDYDADWKSNPTAYSISDRIVSSADTIQVKMAPGGGQAITFKKIK